MRSVRLKEDPLLLEAGQNVLRRRGVRLPRLPALKRMSYLYYSVLTSLIYLDQVDAKEHAAAPHVSNYKVGGSQSSDQKSIYMVQYILFSSVGF